MISFRYHVVSLVAVLLALAAGIAVGSGPLQRETETGPDGSALQQRLDDAEAQVSALQDAATYDDDYAASTAPRMLLRALPNRAVTLVVLPGAEERSVSEVSAAVDTAGGTVTAQVEITEALLDPANRQLVTELASQLQDSSGQGLAIPAGASGYERFGRLLASAIGTTRPGGQAVTPDGDSILAAVSTADLVTTRGTVARRGSLVVLVAGPPYGSADDQEGAGAIVATLADALDLGTRGAVVAGPRSSAVETGTDGGTGVVAAVRADPTAAARVSTVDVIDRTSGAVLAALALAEQQGGGVGHYGAFGADGVLPQRVAVRTPAP